MVMFTGREPGELGMYGFRSRRPGTYNEVEVVDSRRRRFPALWDRAGEAGRRCCLIGVPPSYPPFPVKGDLVSCFLTPGTDRPFTYPRGLAVELEEQGLEYIPDVPFRVEEKGEVLDRLREMTEGHFDIALYLAEERNWDLFILVEIGLDRVQHAFWRYQDPAHHLYEGETPFAGALEEYYVLLDRRVGELLEACGKDTAVAVVSDHGAKAMKGAFCVNQWLADRGYLCVDGKVERGTRLDKAPVDWSRTKAWGWGGYYARIFLNLQGREPEGIIPPGAYERELERLEEELRGIRGPGGEEWKTLVVRPRDVYSTLAGDPPDLMVFFDDLSWRAAGTLGYPGWYLEENDTGPDDAVHDWRGVGILYHPEMDMAERIGERELDLQGMYRVFLDMMGLE
jgi:predicted AlkP superfamily phosphohydrolase/phosphomutase